MDTQFSQLCFNDPKIMLTFLCKSVIETLSSFFSLIFTYISCHIRDSLFLLMSIKSALPLLSPYAVSPFLRLAAPPTGGQLIIKYYLHIYSGAKLS